MFSKPGLTTPVICVPSQSMMTVISVRVFGPLPRSPCHEPTTGWPSCAAGAADAAIHAMKTSSRPVLTSITVFLPSLLDAVDYTIIAYCAGQLVRRCHPTGVAVQATHMKGGIAGNRYEEQNDRRTAAGRLRVGGLCERGAACHCHHL